MQNRNLKITVASQLLSGVCLEEDRPPVQERENVLRYSLQLAEALIRLADDESTPALAHAPPLYTPAEPVQEREFEREPLGSLLQTKRGGPAPRASRGPTLH